MLSPIQLAPAPPSRPLAPARLSGLTFAAARLTALTFLAALLTAPIASAQTSNPTEAEKAELLSQAQSLVNRASRHYSDGEFAEALSALQRAEKLAERARDPSLASIRFNIARCFEQLGRLEEALEAYQRYDQLPDASHRKQKAFTAMRSLEQQVYAVLSVSCSPAGAAVTIPGLIKGQQPCPWKSPRVPAGAYTVEVSAPGYASTSEVIEVAAGRARSLQVTLEPLPGTIPTLSAGAPSGGVDLPTWPLVTLGAGAVAAGVGGVFTAMAIGERDTAESVGPGGTQDDAVSSFETFRTLSYVLYGVGGALAATGVVLFFVPGGEDDPESARLVPGPSGFTVRF